jgi:hypothetical protein
MKLIEVDWFDAESCGGWLERDTMAAKLTKSLTQKSVGYLLHEDKQGILLVQTYQVDGDMVADGLFIPAAYIKDKRELRRK